METTDEQLQMLLKERNELQAKQIEKDVKSDKRSMERLRQSVIWMRAVNKYRKPLESMNQLSKRAGFLKENKAFQWFKRDSVPHANRIVPILVNLGATEDDANEVFKDMYGVPDISETAVSTAEGYVYPNHNGVDDAEGRLGFKNVFLETNNIKPEAGPSGSGKTYSALAIGCNLGNKVALIDTEGSPESGGSAELYADFFDFDCVVLPSYSPATYIDAIKAAAEEGYDVIIIDSLSHAWFGAEGALEQVNKEMARSGSRNSYTAWRNVTPLHNALVQTILHTNASLSLRFFFVAF